MTLSYMYQRPGFLLRRSHQISAAVFENVCAGVGLTQAQYGALMVLASEPGIDQSRLARALAFDKVTVLRVLRGLEDRGLVSREVSASSRRQMAVQLTAEGKRLLKKAEAPVHEAYEQLMAPLDEAQRQQLVSLLQTLTDNLGEQARAAFVPLQHG
ncbi:MarR family winged helix-turn-helix transcriptional regulator [Limnohabitans sp. B9-3]|uniref:MarR family winged helix-turn-helix transcriptional regulator n=1 Tax=Limnohabitans sp. B9-3 TaxID=1100707 RepID=UPI000C1F54E3|nr:MarR family transcriptional regulator [Limnohabitans sp. B9-3]PIT76461.1 MarR family transcriptional regulator [Limnohabitans sp. B9-3]